MTNDIVAIVLAAGRGRRFQAAGGTPFKQSQRLYGSRSLVEHVCDRYAEAGLSVTCALHPELIDDLGQRLTKAGHQVVPVADADQGMGHSLAAAIAATPSETGWLIALADMPRIRAETIRAVADELVDAASDGAAVCAPYYEGRRGHPVAFSAELGPALRGLSGDEGARSILQANADCLRRIDVNDPGVVFDINVPGELLGLAAASQ